MKKQHQPGFGADEMQSQASHPNSGRRLIATYRLTAGITLLGTAALLGCAVEAGDLDEAGLEGSEISDDSIGQVEQAATCEAETVKRLSMDVTQPALRAAYPGAMTNAFLPETPIERGAINNRGEVLVSLQARGTIGSTTGTNSSRAIRWNANTGETKHIGLAANSTQGERAYQGYAHAMNAAGQMAGHGLSCRDAVRSTVWFGDDPATDEFNAATNVFSIAEPAWDASEADRVTFCNRSAAAGDVDVLPEVRGSIASQTAEAFDISDSAQPVVVGAWNGVLGATFLETGGTVIMEAERYTNKVAVGAMSWSPEGAGMRAVPNAGVAINTGFATTSPRLDFDVNFQSTGTFTVWVKASGPNADSDSIHVGIDGVANTTADRISGYTTALGWSRATLDNVNANVTITRPGVHTVNVWMREDGVLVDKIILTKNTAFVPRDTAPANTAESVRLAEASTQTPTTQAYKWDATNGISLLPCTVGSNVAPLPGGCSLNGANLSGLAVNTAGQVVARGLSYFWDTDNTLSNIRDNFKIQALNNQGLVVGTDIRDNEAIWVGDDGDTLNLGLNSRRAYVWTKTGGLTDVASPSVGEPGFLNSPITTATAVNERGEVAGISMLTNCFHAYVWTAATGMVNRGYIGFGTNGLPEVVDINERGELLINAPDGVYLSRSSTEGPQRIDAVNPETGLSELLMDFAIGLNDNSQVAGVSDCTGDLCNEMVVWEPKICVETPSDVYLEAECATTKQGAYTTTRTATTRGAYSGTGYLESTAATPATPGAAVDQASYSVNVATAGNYVLYFRAHTNANANDDSWFYQIDNGAWVTMNNNLQAGWAWYAGNAGAAVNLTAGAHTIRIANRENGLATDKLALIPQGAAAPTGLGGTATNCGTPPPAPVCGDSVCNGTETCSSCASDCQCSSTFPIFSATFDNYAAGNNDGFTFRNDVFGTTATNATARGTDTGRLNVRLGLVPATTANSGAFERTIQLASRSTVTVSFSYGLNMADTFEAAECGEVRARLGNTYYGTGGNSWVVRRCDGGVNNATHTFTTAPLAAGSYTLQLGGYLNDNSAADEIAVTTFDNVVVTGQLAP